MKKDKIYYYNELYSLFLNKKIPKRILINYINNETDDSYNELSDFIGINIKKQLNKWVTNIGIIELVDLMYKEALNNGNIK